MAYCPILLFGPFKGLPMHQVPTEHLNGLLEWPKLFARTRQFIIEELERRKKAADLEREMELAKWELREGIGGI